MYHGYKDRFTIRSKTPELKLTDEERVFYTKDTFRIKNKKIDVLNLSSCLNGNLDFINRWSYGGTEYGQNMAAMMIKGCQNIKTVKAWDGAATYIPIGSGIQYDNEHHVFQEWSVQKNGKMRSTSGLITYTREPDGSISYSPAIKYLYVMGSIPAPVEMTEKIS